MILWRNYHFYRFNINPGLLPLLLYVRCKSGVTFVRRCFRDAKISPSKPNLALSPRITLNTQPVSNRTGTRTLGDIVVINWNGDQTLIKLNYESCRDNKNKKKRFPTLSNQTVLLSYRGYETLEIARSAGVHYNHCVILSAHTYESLLDTLQKPVFLSGRKTLMEYSAQILLTFNIHFNIVLPLVCKTGTRLCRKIRLLPPPPPQLSLEQWSMYSPILSAMSVNHVVKV